MNEDEKKPEPQHQRVIKRRTKADFKWPTPGPTPPPPFPLPELKVVQEEYCTQEMTDHVLRFLHEKRPDLITDIGEKPYNPMAQQDALQRIVGYLRTDADEIEIPDTRLGMIELTFEIYRRYKKAAGEPVLEVSGKPIASGEDEPLCPLKRVPVVERPGIIQEVVDYIIPLSYEERPDLWYELAEAARRGVRPSETMREFTRWAEEIPLPERTNVSLLVREARRCVIAMCGVEKINYGC